MIPMQLATINIQQTERTNGRQDKTRQIRNSARYFVLMIQECKTEIQNRESRMSENGFQFVDL